VASPTPWRLYPREREPVPIVQEAGWAPGPVWTSAENLAPTAIRSPDRPARSESLYRLRYPGHIKCYVFIKIQLCERKRGLKTREEEMAGSKTNVVT
jgi:hypothetical protein